MIENGILIEVKYFINKATYNVVSSLRNYLARIRGVNEKIIFVTELTIVEHTKYLLLL